MKTQVFQELDYEQPTVNIPEAAERAIDIIKSVLRDIPSALPYIMEPSAVVFFAGLRAESPYHSLGDGIGEEDKRILDAVLAKHNIYRFTEVMPADSAYPGDEVFSLVNTSILNMIPRQYGFVKDAWTPLKLDIPFKYAYIEWAFVTERTLARLMDTGRLPKDWLKEWWAPHNLRFGMLLGYPGEAISSSLWDEAHHRAGENEDHTMTEIIIADGKPYFGSRVGFDVSTDAANHPSVKNIEHTWKQVIDRVYEAVPLTEIMHNEKFAESYRQLKRRETNES